MLWIHARYNTLPYRIQFTWWDIPRRFISGFLWRAKLPYGERRSQQNLATILYEEQRFLTHAIAWVFQNLLSWMLEYFLGAWLQPLLLSFLPKIPLSTIALFKKKHITLYLKHDYNVPHTYNKLSNFVSWLLGILFRKQTHLLHLQWRCQHRFSLWYSSYMIVDEFFYGKTIVRKIYLFKIKLKYSNKNWMKLENPIKSKSEKI